MHTIKFTQHLVNHLRAVAMFAVTLAFDLRSIHDASFKPLHLISSTGTLSYLRHCSPEAHLEDVMQKKKQDPLDGVTVGVSIEI